MSVQEIANKAVNAIKDGARRNLLSGSLHPDATWMEKVRGFHRLYEAPIRWQNELNFDASHMTDERMKLRLDLIKEEYEELEEAVATRDVVEMADALGDIIYVVCGFAVELGIDLKAVVNEIHASNFTKLAEDGSVIKREDGKVLKGPNYLPPNIRAVLENQLNKKA